MHRFFLCPLLQVVSLRHAGAVDLRCGLVDSTKGLYTWKDRSGPARTARTRSGPARGGPARPDRPGLSMFLLFAQLYPTVGVIYLKNTTQNTKHSFEEVKANDSTTPIGI